MCECRPAKSSAPLSSTCLTASSAAPEASEKPNFWSSCAVATNSCTAASTPVVTRTSTRGRGAALRLASGRSAIRVSRAISSKESTTM